LSQTKISSLNTKEAAILCSTSICFIKVESLQ